MNWLMKHLSREGSTAKAGYSKWLAAASALLVHIALGQVYAVSYFNAPLNAAMGKSVTSFDSFFIIFLEACAVFMGAYALSTPIMEKAKALGVSIAAAGVASVLLYVLVFANASSLTVVSSIFTVAIAFLGGASAYFGKWVERSGPRKAIAATATLFCSGLVVAGIGASIGSFTLVLLGYGVLCGFGLGIGYIGPVSSLIKWFKDSPGLATGLAIMGFGGGAFVGGPLAKALMDYFKASSSAGISEAFLCMAAIYAVMQFSSAFFIRMPADAVSTVDATKLAVVEGHTVAEALKTNAFWLLWTVLLCSVTAGIGVLGQAPLMVQKLLGVSAALSVGFIGLLSMCNMTGRLGWSSLSDKIGRRNAYFLYGIAGGLCYIAAPFAAEAKNIALFTVLLGVALSFYGAGFATIPAYLADMFGRKEVGAIHGRLLTAWSLAVILGTSLVNAGRDYMSKTAHFTDAHAYGNVMYVMGGLLFLMAFVNYFVKKPAKA